MARSLGDTHYFSHPQPTDSRDGDGVEVDGGMAVVLTTAGYGGDSNCNASPVQRAER